MKANGRTAKATAAVAVAAVALTATTACGPKKKPKKCAAGVSTSQAASGGGSFPQI